MAEVKHSSIIDVAKAIRKQLIAAAGFTSSSVYITSRKTIPHFRGEKDCVLRILGERPDEAAIRGAGRLNDQRTRGIQLIIRTRMATDRAGSDERHLLNEDVGHVAVEDQVFNALEIFWPADVASNALTNCPIRLGPLTDAVEDVELPEWLSSSVVIEIDYSRNVQTNTML
jgi:hypothetical protein